MKIWVPLTSFAAAAALLILGLAAREAIPAIFAVFASGIGVGTLFPALKDQWTRPSEPTPGNVSELERRLAVTESELAATSSELLQLKQRQDFDLKLRMAKPASE